MRSNTHTLRNRCNAIINLHSKLLNEKNVPILTAHQKSEHTRKRNLVQYREFQVEIQKKILAIILACSKKTAKPLPLAEARGRGTSARHCLCYWFNVGKTAVCSFSSAMQDGQSLSSLCCNGVRLTSSSPGRVSASHCKCVASNLTTWFVVAGIRLFRYIRVNGFNGPKSALHAS